jgi:hypothetical protein
MTIPDTIAWLRDFWFNRSEKAKWWIIGVVALILFLI